MLKRPSLLLIAALLLAGIFVYGIARLFILRFQAGDVYPIYSTMRADPLGAKGLFDALDHLPGVEARRHFKSLDKLQPGQPVTMVFLGLSTDTFATERELAAFESLVFGGSRAVFAFFPQERKPDDAEALRERKDEKKKKLKRVEDEKNAKSSDKPKDKDNEKDTDKEKDEDEEERSLGLRSFDEFALRYGFQFGDPPRNQNESGKRRASLVEPGGKLEPELSWHSAMFFKDLSPEWKPLYLGDSQPVLLERSYGRGSIVIASDTYLFSNEALRKERLPKLLARIFDGPPLIVFDEEHFGLSEQQNIAQLALKYRLHGVIAGCLLLAILFVWMNAARFVPPFEESRLDDDFVSGLEASQGFNNLLHRSVKIADLLGACVEEWRRTSTQKPGAIAHVEEVLARELALPPGKRDVVGSYREISRIISRKTHP